MKSINFSNFQQSLNQNHEKLNYQNNFSSVSAMQKSKKSYVDDFINETKAAIQKNEKNKNSLRRYLFGGYTAGIPIFLSSLFGVAQFIRIVRAGKLPKEAFFKVYKNAAAKYFASLAAGIIGTFALSKYFNSKTEENYEKLKDKFDKLNTKTNAELADSPVYNNNGTAAECAPATGKITINGDILNDPILGNDKSIEKLIKHELTHAGQYETIARSKDGIKKLNHAVLKTTADRLIKSGYKNYYSLVYNDIINGGDKYKDTKITILNLGEVNLKDYIGALHTLINNQKATYNDIPVLINADHYQKVINEKGELTPDEERKAEEYYNALLSYPILVNRRDTTKSAYKQNILEVEARAEAAK